MKLPAGAENYSELEKYKQLVTENYKEPVQGEYEDVAKRILKAMEMTADETEEDDDMENVEEMDNSYVICD